MDGLEYLYSDTSPSDSMNYYLMLLIVMISMFGVFPIYMLNRRCEKKKEEPILPVTDNMIHSYSTQDNPFLKLRIVAYSAAEEALDKKPTVIV